MSEDRDLLHTTWKDTLHYRKDLLSPENVLDYFSNSPFYDRTCNNQKLKDQGLGIEALQSMTGFEYVLDSHSDGIFVIMKRERLSKVRYENIALYYIVDGSIYQAPDIQSTVEARLNRALYYYRKTADLLNQGWTFSLPAGRERVKFQPEPASSDPTLIDILFRNGQYDPEYSERPNTDKEVIQLIQTLRYPIQALMEGR
ncbi:putative Mediator of RNA polymerase II transcription subunit 6 [Blattamonas nauphoetae]|uniref:Mediator of RNA polymerase II transcription subunit 6 n=1 Tax=Blattamonas nauphoetae TaxID=2049346 RepID=A0ABQ9XP14_9EUKA|nr:putative Mediator of RNA polymerase II transcription subunit 6 [Blattamonas nauphoetae]